MTAIPAAIAAIAERGGVNEAALSGRYTSGTLGARPTAAAFGPGYYFATDDNGGTLYHSDGLTWTKNAPGATLSPKGLLGSTKNTTSISQALTAAFTDLTGMSVTFTYNGRPIYVVARLPFSKFSVVSIQITLRLIDGTGSGTLNGKLIYEEIQTSDPSVTNYWTNRLQSDPLTQAADGTPMVAGTAYTWKLQSSAGTNGTYSTVWSANSVFYGHLAVYEA